MKYLFVGEIYSVFKCLLFSKAFITFINSADIINILVASFATENNMLKVFC